MATTEHEITFAQGVAGYSGVQDTQINQGNANTSYGNATSVSVDNSPLQEVLLRFDDIFSANSVPLGADIVSATLTLRTTNAGNGGSFYRMLTSWSESSTWNSLSGGVSTNGVEAMSAADFSTGAQNIGTTTLDVTSAVQAWSNGATNYGWLIKSLGSNGWDFSTSEGSVSPKLTIRYSVDNGPPPPNTPPTAFDDAASVVQGGSVVINVLANDRDANNDTLSVTGTTQPSNGTVSVGADNKITYSPTGNFVGTDTFKYDITDHNGGTSKATVTVTVNPPPALNFSGATGYIALNNAAGSTGNFEHTNASKSFFHDGTWWAILPEQTSGSGGLWSIFQFSGTLPNPGAVGGWSVASNPLLSSSYHADIAWDEARGNLYTLMYGSNSSNSYLIKMSYDQPSHMWSTDATVNLTSWLNPRIYGSNNDLAVGVDQFGNPVVLAIGSGTTKGLHFAYSASSDLSNWTSTVIDGNTTTAGGTNGDSKADFVYFDNNGVKELGIIYSQDSNNDGWRFAWHDVTDNTASYAGGWQNELITNSISIDDHISAVSYDGKIYAAVKDASNALWLLSGSPGAWEDPIRIVSGAQGRSRPIVTLDETGERLYIAYQQSTKPGDVYLKVADLKHPVFDSASKGTAILTGFGSADSFINPQGPAHAVGLDTDGYFPIFARESGGSEVWWNGIMLSDYDLIA